MFRKKASSHLNHQGQSFLIDIMSRRDKWIFRAFVTAWLAALISFWTWWLQADHVFSWGGIILISLWFAWETFLSSYYFFHVSRMKRPNPAISIPEGWRVAMVVTKAPSEPWTVVEKTLRAMLSQAYPHDTWLADEDPQPETIAWCQAHGVQISTRKGIAAYHRPTWPRRTRCKEGNLAYFYDKYGYDNYDFVSQLDADHVPEPGYLEAMIRPFVNPQVGYVAAPSICDANAEESWVVNARAFAEGPFHGAQQAGYNDGWAPMCIGSHYAVRAAALKQIGGLGPELAEDHSTTLLMNAHGWRGVFAFDAEAHGDGPACFTDFLVQEFQWARSVTMIALSMTPRYFDQLKPHLKFQFLFCQLWYPLYGLSFFVGFSLPIIALLRDTPWASVNYFEFFARYSLVVLASTASLFWIARRGWLRPKTAKILSWESCLFPLARWPWILLGVGNAVISWLFRKELCFKVTPKGANAPKPLPLKALFPHLVLIMGSAFAVIAISQVSRTPGYYFLALLNGAFYILLCTIILGAHLRENRDNYSRYVKQKFAFLVALGCLATAVSVRSQEALKGVSATGQEPFIYTSLTAKDK